MTCQSVPEGLKKHNGTPKHKPSSDAGRPHKSSVKSSETPQKKTKSKPDKKHSPPKPKPRVCIIIVFHKYLLYFIVFTVSYSQ